MNQFLTGHVILAPTDTITPLANRREYDCVFMQPGFVKSADGTLSTWRIPAEAIEPAAPLFDSVACHVDHPRQFGFGWRTEPQVSTIAGVTFQPAWDSDAECLRGGIRLYDTGPGSPAAFVQALLDQIIQDRAAGRTVPRVGLSASMYHRPQYDEESGITTTTQIDHVESVDIVYDAGAGGYVHSALSAAGFDPTAGFRRVWAFPDRPHTGGFPMQDTNTDTISADDRVDLTNADGTSPPSTDTIVQQQPLPNLPDSPPATHVHISAPPAPQPDARVDELAARLDALDGLMAERNDDLVHRLDQLTTALATREAARTIQDCGDPRGLHNGLDPMEQVEMAFRAMLTGTRPEDDRVRPLTGIRELYLLLSGDYEMTGMFQPDRVTLANVNSSTMASLVANQLNKTVVNQFMEYPRWWAPIVVEEDFGTLQDVQWISLGGVGELPTVSEGAAYTELTWDDQKESTSFVKKGGYLGLTIEAIDKDDTRRMRMAPRALAQAAWLTLGKSVSGIFTDNSGVGPTLDTDSTALFHTNHSNLGTTALSWAEWVVVRTAMRKQTEINSSERLGALTAPKFCLVPPDLEATALQIFASEGEPGTADNDENPWADGNVHTSRMAAARRKVIVVDLWTDTNNWAAVADPRLYPGVAIGYRYGRTPELYSVASPTAGLMFSNDTLPVKVRFFYACGVVDYRGLYKENV